MRSVLVTRDRVKSGVKLQGGGGGNKLMTHIQIPTGTYTHKHIPTHTYTYIYPQAHIYPQGNTYIHTPNRHIHTHTYTHRHIYMYSTHMYMYKIHTIHS